MTLAAEVQARINTQLLRELTRFGQSTATTVDTAVLQSACDDAAADLALRAGITFDVTDIRHVRAAVAGVVYFLHENTGMASEGLRRWEGIYSKAAERLALTIGSKRRVQPTTSGVSAVPERRVDAKQFGDPARWTDYTLNAPTSQESGGDDRLPDEVS